ncbi:MAG: glycosyltransferase [Myxococcota bacterium]
MQPQHISQQQPAQPANRQRIVVLCSQGGYTHLSLAKVIGQLIGHHYDIDIVYIFDETFDNFGTKIQRRIIGKEGSDAFYNRLLGQDKRKTLNFLVKYMARGYYRSNRRRVSELIAKHIQHPRTAMLISVVPFINGAAMLAAQQRNIPLMVVSVDSNLAIWLADATRPFYPSCVWLLPYNLPSMHQQLHRAAIAHNAVAFAGLPVRQQFFHPPNRETARQQLGITPTTFTLMIMMGGSGSLASLEYVQVLARQKFQGHVIVVAGRQKQLLLQLQHTVLPPGMSATYLGFTKEIDRYMAAADLLLTKPGPTTFHEAIHMQLPLLLENSKTPLMWEKTTLGFVKQQQLGMLLNKTDQLPQLLHHYQNNQQLQQLLHHNMQRYRQQLPDFRRVFCHHFCQLLQHNTCCNS